MNKKILPTLALLSAGLILTGCGSSGIDRSYVTVPTSISTNYGSLNMFEGESVKLTVSFAPNKAYNSKFVIETSDANIASVNSNGTVTARKTGSCIVTVSYKEDSNLSTSIPVRVNKSLTKGKEFENELKKMITYQQTHYQVSPDKVKVREIRRDTTSIDGVLCKDTREDSVLTSSLSEGFFRIEGIDYEMRTADGGLITTPYGWTFTCDSDFISRIYHDMDGSKTVLSVPTQSYSSKGRIAPVLDILDALFTSGKDILTNNYKNVLSTESLTSYINEKDYKRYVQKVGVGDNMVTYTYGGTGSSTADYDDETYFYIPYGTKYDLEFYQKMVWDKGIMRTLDLYQTMSYTLNGKEYVKTIEINESYAIDAEFELVYPNYKEYRAVKDIFDL